MPVKSLVELATRSSIKNVGSISSVGDLPYNLVRPILEKVDSAHQLHCIELSSPLVQGETTELWRALIRKHFPDWEKKNYVPKNPESWHRVYSKYDREQKAAIAQAEAVLMERMGALQKEKDAKLVGIIPNRLMPKMPRSSRAFGSGPRRTGGGPDLPSHLGLNAGIRTKMTNGKSVLRRARKEAREISYRQNLSTPSGNLPVRTGQITKAPEGMVHDHRLKSLPAVRIKPPAPSRSRVNGDQEELASREARLMALKKSHSSKPVTVVSDSDDESDGDVYGQEPSSSMRPTLPAASRKGSGLLSNAHRPPSERNIRYATSRTAQAGSSSAQASNHIRSAYSPDKTAAPSSSTSSKYRPARISRSPSPIRAPPIGETSLSPPVPGPSESPIARKRKDPVDIFMRPKKQVRR